MRLFCSGPVHAVSSITSSTEYPIFRHRETFSDSFSALRQILLHPLPSKKPSPIRQAAYSIRFNRRSRPLLPSRIMVSSQSTGPRSSKCMSGDTGRSALFCLMYASAITFASFGMVRVISSHCFHMSVSVILDVSAICCVLLRFSVWYGTVFIIEHFAFSEQYILLLLY